MRASIILKIIINFPFLQGNRFNIFSFTPTITEVFSRSSDLSTTFRKINIRGKPIFRTFRNISCVRNDIKITCNHMPCRGIYILRILTISGVRSIGIYIYIRYNFIKVRYRRPNWFVIFIGNDRSVRIIKVIWKR